MRQTKTPCVNVCAGAHPYTHTCLCMAVDHVFSFQIILMWSTSFHTHVCLSWWIYPKVLFLIYFCPSDNFYTMSMLMCFIMYLCKFCHWQIDKNLYMIFTNPLIIWLHGLWYHNLLFDLPWLEYFCNALTYPEDLAKCSVLIKLMHINQTVVPSLG